MRALEAADIGFGAVVILGLMNMKTRDYRLKYWCAGCRYKTKSAFYSKCIMCNRQHGSNWEKPLEPKKVYCECCGQEKHL